MKLFGMITGKICLILAILLALDISGVLGLTYSTPKENQPLKNPIQIIKIEPRILYLEDGRTIRLESDDYYAGMFGIDESMVDYFSDRPHEVEIEETNTNGLQIVRISVAERWFICGTPWARLINIRLIPMSFPKYKSTLLASGEASELIELNSEQ